MAVDRKIINDLDFQDVQKVKNAVDPTAPQDYATKKYVDDNGGSVSVTDGSTTVDPATSLDFTSGATVTDGGGGVAEVAVTSSFDLPGTIHAATSKTTPADADEFAITDSAASYILKKLSGTNLKAYLKSYFDTIYTGSGSSIPSDGWETLSALTYASVDGNTGVVTTTGDLTGTISVGARVKLTQTTVKYFIVTAIDSTTMTLFGGTDYTLANASITSPSWSPVKAPHGFPLDPAKWTVEVTSTSDCVKSSPTQNTWYGDTGLSATGPSISIPIGCWRVYYMVVGRSQRATSTANDVYVSLSTSASSESDTTMTAFIFAGGASGTIIPSAPITRERSLTLAARTTYYVVIKTDTTSVASIQLSGSVSTSIIRAVCAYL